MSPQQLSEIEQAARGALLAARGNAPDAKRKVSDEEIDRLVKRQMQIVRAAISA